MEGTFPFACLGTENDTYSRFDSEYRDSQSVESRLFDSYYKRKSSMFNPSFDLKISQFR